MHCGKIWLPLAHQVSAADLNVKRCGHVIIAGAQVQAAQAGVGWARTREWVETAAAKAPLTTEALLHSFITSSDSLPGATAPAWLRDDNPSSPRMGKGNALPPQLLAVRHHMVWL